MPSSKNYVRNYQQENKYKKKPEQIKKRSSRNAARRKMKQLGRECPPGKHVDHKDGNANNNNPSNLHCVSASKNSSYPRTKKAGKKNKSD